MGDSDKLEIKVDREACIGDGACCNDAPETFEMDDDDIATVKKPWGDARETILEAAQNCPTDAIKVVDTSTGETLYPQG
jgi:ferredoxin